MTAACELLKPQLLAVVESCNSDTEACSCSVPLKRSNSCSALSDASFATEETYPAEDDYSVHSCDAVQEGLAYADDSSVHSCDASLVLSTAINDSCSLSGAVAEQTSAEQAASHLHRRRKHKHKHRHKHRTGSAHNHASHDRSSSAQDFRGRKGGTEGRLAEQSLMALLESSRPRSAVANFVCKQVLHYPICCSHAHQQPFEASYQQHHPSTHACMQLLKMYVYTPHLDLILKTSVTWFPVGLHPVEQVFHWPCKALSIIQIWRSSQSGTQVHLLESCSSCHPSQHCQTNQQVSICRTAAAHGQHTYSSCYCRQARTWAAQAASLRGCCSRRQSCGCSAWVGIEAQT